MVPTISMRHTLETLIFECVDGNSFDFTEWRNQAIKWEGVVTIGKLS